MNEQAENQEMQIEEMSGIGRIEVVPEVLIDIVAQTALLQDGVARLADLPPGVARRTKRRMRQDGVTLELDDDGAAFDLYLIMQPHVNMLETGRAIQVASIDAVDKMVGIPVKAVNIHIEDIVYSADDAN
ncbi:MAG: Asp23/Gls24 family envelope stress response protein [Anaerolineae bacterium]|nr:Asp23/Gls24 family envelope stress response protein [Anaerolineae bacterium]MCO5197785.1 Asp23/Gls24 family envelope stress response protein [Anaerolineae bacterium]MCO5207324.1 Asp23/Gls24 family envelope stress response protein [Anaerolineae bacterium]